MACSLIQASGPLWKLHGAFQIMDSVPPCSHVVQVPAFPGVDLLGERLSTVPHLTPKHATKQPRRAPGGTQGIGQGIGHVVRDINSGGAVGGFRFLQDLATRGERPAERSCRAHLNSTIEETPGRDVWRGF